LYIGHLHGRLYYAINLANVSKTYYKKNFYLVSILPQLSKGVISLLPSLIIPDAAAWFAGRSTHSKKTTEEGLIIGYTLAIDTGGTFTDGFFVCGDRVATVKVPTTPHDLTACFLECIKAGADQFGVPVEDFLYEADIIRFSNTIGTNTIIQREGSKIGLLVTAGCEALAPSGDSCAAAPLVAPDMVMTIDEAVSGSGTVTTLPDEQASLAAAQELIDRGARCLVVAFTNSEYNPENERLVRMMIKREYPRDFLGSVPVFLSSDISSRSGTRQRMNAAVLNAYIHEKLVRLLYKAGEDLRRRLYRKSLLIVHNNGAVARVAKTRAINTYNSGPAAGLLGARLVGRLYGIQNLISADMGGTSFDIGFVHNAQAELSLSPDVEGFDVNVPMLSIRAIGAGGGSIASVREGRLQVGPQSAGALPGPVCFDLGGGEPTVTDADLTLGILDPDYFLGGGMKLNATKARTVLQQKIADPLGIAPEKAALEIKRTVDSAMGQEIKRLREHVWPSSENPVMVVYGGAGPVHCCSIARAAGIRKIIITPFSAVFSAFAASGMDVGHLYNRRIDCGLAEQGDMQILAGALESMQQEAVRDMRGEGFADDQVTMSLELFIRSPHDAHEVTISADTRFFHDGEGITHIQKRAAELLGIPEGEGDGLQLTTVSLKAQAAVPHYSIPEYPPCSRDVQSAVKDKRRVFTGSESATHEVRVYDRQLLASGHQISGPLIVESEHTTMFVPEGWEMAVDHYNNIVLEDITDQ